MMERKKIKMKIKKSIVNIVVNTLSVFNDISFIASETL